MTTRYCVQCGAELESADRFCQECGAPQSEQERRAPQSSQALSKLSPPVLLLVIGILLLAGGALFYVLGRTDPEQVAVQEPANIPAAAVESDIPYPEVTRISVEEAKAQIDGGTAVLLDVRPLSDYETGHAANALSIPLTELPDRYTELPPEAAILTYCT